MAVDNNVYFVVCNDCDHKLNTRKLKEIDIKVIKSNLQDYPCSSCGSSNVTIKEKPKTKPVFTYVATEMTTDRVFHKSTCGHMQHVPAQNEIRFKDKEEAIRRNFKPCTSCRP